ncbi:MAG: sporulation protein YqfD [Clostridia bacterium]|nr:sporulation protein YqfD [Clostridia bacterium]
MFLIRFIRFLRGYVVFTCTGGFPERFINLCSLNGINLWDAKSTGGVLSAKTTVSCYKNIRRCVRKSGMKIRICKKCGLPFLIQPYIKRKGLAAGLVISAVMLVYLCSCVWTFDVSGNEKFTDEQILKIAQMHDINIGSFSRNTDPKKIQTAVKSEIDGISWFSVNINGSHVSLEVSESSGSDEIIDYDTPCNIISDTDGELLHLEAHTGTPALKAGSAVTKGDLLISGVMEKTDGTPYFVHARGTAVIRTNQKVSAEIPLNTKTQQISDIRSRYSLYIFGLEIPLSAKRTADFVIRRSSMLDFRQKALPVGLITENYFYKTDANAALSADQAILLACYSAFSQEQKIMLCSETETKTVTVDSTEKSAKIDIDYINHKTTGIEHYFEITD